MITDPLFYKLLLLALVWLCVMLPLVWPSAPPAARAMLPKPVTPPRKRPKEPQPFAGLTRKPHCDACAYAVAPRREPPAAPPLLLPPRGRPRIIDTSHHFWPDPHCAYYGRVGLGTISANGHPNGGPWRQLSCSQEGRQGLGNTR